ncbi:MAG: hypothetical protein QF752_04120 [Planctomycetota bacterium]|nr:hypothetical protein [Planctomycetota bacterium]
MGRSGGDLRNFGFCILAPDGKEILRKSNRGPNFLYGNSGKMAADLRQIAKQYVGKRSAKSATPSVPKMKSVRLGINVASCEGLPCLVIVGKTQAELDRLLDKLSAVIWEEELVGKFICASTKNRDDLDIVTGETSRSGFLVIQPDVYGMKGRLITVIDRDASTRKLRKSLSSAADRFTRNSKSHGDHVRYGRRNGEVWKTEVPVPERTRSSNRRSR